MEMRIIKLGDGTEWACNKEGEGIFSRLSDGSWAQHRGTSQTIKFRVPRALSRYVHKNHRGANGEPLARMVGSRGWA